MLRCRQHADRFLARQLSLNPAAKIIYTSLGGLVDDLGKYITFTLEFYGQLDIELNALKVNSLTGIDGGKTTIAGKMGVLLSLIMTFELKREAFGAEIMMGFKANADTDGYFGGEFIIDADKQGIFTKPVLKFSGLQVKAKITGYIGKFKRTIKLQDENGDPITVVEEEKLPLQKKYVT